MLERIQKFISYEPMSGCWIWSGAWNLHGYGKLRHSKVYWLAHRFIWTMFNGPIPDGSELDHRCHNPACVNPEHLRLASHGENMRNSLMQRNNRTGLKGVSWRPDRRKWRATIMASGVFKHLGYFNSPDDAHKAYCRAASQLHGQFANPGVPHA